MNALHRTYTSAPSALAYMLQAFRPSPGWRSERGCPDMRLTWRNYRVDPAAAAQLAAICGLDGAGASTRVAILFPQVTGFRLIMAMLTHASWPLPIWNALQVRNRITLHGPLRADEQYGLEVRPSGWRVLAKGLEIDLHTILIHEGQLRWESVVTFYYRGRYGDATESGDSRSAPANSPAVDMENPSAEIVRWNVGDGHRRAFAKLTGDYNGLHQWDAYARRMGFPAAFPHPQRVLGQALAHLPNADHAPLTLDLWIKGPVFFGRGLLLRHWPATGGAARTFEVWLQGESRPALVGTLGRPIPAQGRGAG